MTPNRFDVHAHYMPRGAVGGGAPRQNFLASPMPTWSPEFALDFMDRRDIATQMLSVPTPLPKDQARRVNEYGATLVNQFPIRFCFLPSLPMYYFNSPLSD